MALRNLNKKSQLPHIMIGGLIVASIVFLWFATINTPKTSQEFIGQNQLAILQTASKAEKALLFIDQAANMAAEKTMADIAKGGGSYHADSESPICKDYYGYNFWQYVENGEIKRCYPDNKEGVFSYVTNINLDNILNLYPDQEVNSYGGIFSLLFDGNAIKGIASEPLNFNIVVEKKKDITDEVNAEKNKVIAGSPDIENAISQIIDDETKKNFNTPYKLGGSVPGVGIDCSGWVTYLANTIRKNYGLSVLWNGHGPTAQDWGNPKLSTQIEEKDLRPGDIVLMDRPSGGTGNWMAGRTWDHIVIVYEKNGELWVSESSGGSTLHDRKYTDFIAMRRKQQASRTGYNIGFARLNALQDIYKDPSLYPAGTQARPKGTAGGKTVVIDPGHGTPSNPGDDNEREIVLQIGLKLQKLLEAKGIKVVMTRTTTGGTIGNAKTQFDDNKERAAIANNQKADFIIRIHSNSGKSDGFFFMYPEPEKGCNPSRFSQCKNGDKGPSAGIADESKRASQIISDAVASEIKKKHDPEPDSRSQGGHNLVGSVYTEVPTALIEMYGHENTALYNKYKSNADGTQDKMAKALADGILGYLGGISQPASAATTSAAAATGPAATSGTQKGETFIVVDGSCKKDEACKLYLVEGSKYTKYDVAIGSRGMGKTREKDHKTPVGTYHIKWMASKKDGTIKDGTTWCSGNNLYYGSTGPSDEKLWTDSYGGSEAAVMGLDYPNSDDLSKKYTGGCIEIHASKSKTYGWQSLGCVKMNPTDANEVYQAVKVGTKVILEDKPVDINKYLKQSSASSADAAAAQGTSGTTATNSNTYRGMPVSVGFKTPNGADRFKETTPVSVSNVGGPPYFISYVESEKTKNENVIALTYDLCSANSGFDKELVDYLIQNKIPATFFISSAWINDGHEKDLKYLIDAGIFTIASHSKTHEASGNAGNGIFKDVKTTKDRMISEFEDPHNLLKKYGVDNKMCRLPVAQPWSLDAIGNLEFLKDATQYCQDFIQYDIWVTEGTRASADAYASSVLNNLKSGRASIILSHAGHPDWHNKNGVALLVQKLKDKNYKFVTIPDLLDDYAPSASAGTSTAGTVSSAGGEAKSTVTMTAAEKEKVDRVMQYDDFIRKYSEKYGIGANVVRAMIAWESSGKPDAISYTGCAGLGQFCYGTAKSSAYYPGIFKKLTPCGSSNNACNAQNDDRFNPEKSIEATSKYLSASYKTYDGNIYLIAISYNAGPDVANAIKSSLGDKLPTYENIRPLLDAAVLKHFKDSKIKEVDTHMKMVARFYEIFGGQPEVQVQTEITPTGEEKTFIVRTIGKYSVFPSFTVDLPFGLGDYDIIRKEVQGYSEKKGMLDISADCERSGNNLDKCVSGAVSEINQRQEMKDAGLTMFNGPCNPKENLWSDFVEGFGDCAGNEEDGCYCEIPLNLPDQSGFKDEIKIKAEKDGQGTKISLDGNAALSYGFDSAIEKDGTFTVKDGKGLFYAKKQDNKMSISETKPDNTNDCGLEKREFKFCVLSNNGKKLQYEFAIGFPDSIPPQPVENLRAKDKEKAKSGIIIDFDAPKENRGGSMEIVHDLSYYLIYCRSTEFMKDGSGNAIMDVLNVPVLIDAKDTAGFMQHITEEIDYCEDGEIKDGQQYYFAVVSVDSNYNEGIAKEAGAVSVDDSVP